MPRKQFAVIGLGRFGRAVSRSLYQQGHEVLAIEESADEVRRAAAEEVATHVVQADSTDRRALEELGVAEFDAVVVAIGTDLEASVLVLLNLLELGVRRIVAKALDERHGRVLARIGGSAVQIVFPERQMGERIAGALGGTGIFEAIELDPEYSIVELPAPASFVGKTISELDLRGRYGVTLIALKGPGKLSISPLGTDRIASGDVLALVGANARLQGLPR